MSAHITKTFGRNPIMCIDKVSFKKVYNLKTETPNTTFSSEYGRNPIMLINDKTYKSTAMFKSNPFFSYIHKYYENT
jgi:hypothetical protein